MDLTITTSTAANGLGNEQVSTQNPQAATSANFGAGTASSDVQPGITASSLLSSQGTIPLGGASPLTVDLANTTAASSARTGVAPPIKHHTNSMLLSFSVVLIVIAVGLIWATTRSVNKTTH